MGSFKKLSLFVAVFLAVPALFAGSNEVLSLVPSNAVSVGMVRLSDIRTSPILGHLINETDKITVDGEAAKFLRETGLKPSEDIDSMTFALLPAGTIRGDGRALVIFEGSFNAEKITNAIIRRGAGKVAYSRATYLRMTHEKGNQGGAIAFLSNHIAIAGHEDAVKLALASRPAGGSDFARRAPLGRQLLHVDPTANAWAVIDVTRARLVMEGPTWGTSEKDPRNLVAGMLKSVESVVLWTRESSDELVLGGHATSKDDDTAQAIEDLIRGALGTWRLAVSERVPALVPVIRRFKVDRDGLGVTFRGSVPGKLIRDGMKKIHASK
ncbi:MAG TPA: hypothetical protein VNM92_01525 [Thermoanaerobaculia bacterium]|nr:hypothetical protein [Thermoanaerobaculia bacterium]